MIYKHKLITLMTIFSFMSVGWGQDCDENMFWTDCGLPFECNPTCSIPNPPPDCLTVCEVGCFCNEGYIFSNDSFNECILIENCSGQSLCDEGYVELWGECYTITFTTYLDLSEMGLSGEIPSEIGDLTNLTNLDLGGNQLSGDIPSEIGDMTNLTILDLGGNQLSGEIPSEICNLTNLTELELGGNQLSGEIPSEIGNLNNLTFLHLEYNQLSGEIPSEIGNLTNLIWLNFIHNQLIGEIPSSICNIDMNWNNPDNFNISNNQLCSPYPDCISEDDVGEQDTSECLYIGDECFTDDEVFGYYDCDLCCQTSELIDNWLGDGVCDMYLFSGCSEIFPNFDCYELGYDCGDCESYGGTPWDGSDPLGFCYEIDFCDLNFDGEINILDVIIVLNCIIDDEGCDYICMDYNDDGEVNILDVILMVNIILDI